MTHRPRERGSISPLVLYGALVVGVMGIGGATIGRIVQAKREVQRAADAAALAAADAMREEGRNANPSGAVQLAARNSRLATNITTSFNETVANLFVASRATQNVETPHLIFNGDARVRAGAVAKIDQERRTITSDGPSDVVLVLDYSGSMIGAPIETLESSLRQHLSDQRIPLDYAAALFSDSLVGDVPFGPSAIQDILELFLNKDASGGTSPEFGFDKAREFLGNPPAAGKPRYVVFVSDGEPSNPGAATEGSRRLWDEADPTVLTVQIGPSGDQCSSRFMVSVSGPKDPPRDNLPEDWRQEYCFPVSDMESFRKALAEVIAKIACPLEPLDRDRVKDPLTVRAFLQDRNGREIKLKPMDDLAGNSADLGFKFNRTTYEIGVTIEACARMREDRSTLVVRYNRALLVE